MPYGKNTKKIWVSKGEGFFWAGLKKSEPYEHQFCEKEGIKLFGGLGIRDLAEPVECLIQIKRAMTHPGKGDK